MVSESRESRLVATDRKAIILPSEDILGTVECPLAWAPRLETLTSSILAVCRSSTTVSIFPLRSPGNKFEAHVPNATKRPSCETAGNSLNPFASMPVSAGKTGEMSRVQVPHGEE